MMKPLLAALLIGGLVTACADTKVAKHAPEETPKRDKTAGHKGYKIGVPYQIKGKWYYPKEDFAYSETGIASWYGSYFHGRATANGEIYDMNDLTAAHKTLPMPSMVRVTNLDNGRSLKLRVNDRGPFVDGRIIDVSRRASQLLGFHENGLAKVKVDILADESRVLAGLAPNPADKSAASSVMAAKGYPSETQSVAYASAASAQTPAPSSSTARNTAYRNAAYAPARGVAPQSDRKAPLSLPSMVTAAGHDGPGLGEGKQSAAPTASRSRRNIYVQAGAFSYADNAETAREQLRNVGPVLISPVQRDGRDFFRVRVGPLASEDEADRLLAAVVRAGFATSRVVHE